MRIEKLTVENFSSFYGKHEFEFPQQTGKNLFIILGGSGYGKTSIFDAINWALYGEQYESTLVEKTIIDFVNETAFSGAAKNNKGIEVSSTLHFEHNGKHHTISQSLFINPSREDGSGKQISDRQSALYEIDINGNHKRIKALDSFLNEILPTNVRDYFLFNGDRINQLSSPTASNEIRDGIYRVVDLELLQNGVEHLQESARYFRRLAKDAAKGEAADIEEQYSKQAEEHEDLKDQLNNLVAEKRAIQDRSEVLNDKLRELGPAIELQKRRDSLTTHHKLSEERLEEIKAELKATSAIAAMGVSIEILQNLEDQLEEMRSKGEIPSSISERLLEDILEIHKCICGSEFVHGDHIFNELTQRLQREKEKERKGQDLLDLFFEVRASRENIQDSQLRMRQLDEFRAKYDSEIVEIDKELTEILTKLENLPDEDVSKLANNLAAATSELIDINRKINLAANRIEEKEKALKELEIKRDKASQSQEQVQRYQLRERLAQEATSELHRIFEDFAEDSRKQIEQLTSLEFTNFIPTANALSIGISKEFHYDVRDQNGHPALQQLSNGQKQALSLAYITSISRVSEKDPPLVIDMPFGRLDEEVQTNIAKRLPELASQIILLMLPGPEWNEETAKILRPNAAAIYKLDFDENTRQTTIMKG